MIIITGMIPIPVDLKPSFHGLLFYFYPLQMFLKTKMD